MYMATFKQLVLGTTFNTDSKLSIEENIGTMGTGIIKTNMNILNNSHMVIIDKQLAPSTYEILHKVLGGYLNVGRAFSMIRETASNLSIHRVLTLNIAKYQQRVDRQSKWQFFIVDRDKINLIPQVVNGGALTLEQTAFEIDQNMTFGVEIECHLPMRNHEFARWFNENYNTIKMEVVSNYSQAHVDGHSYWKIVTDSSLTGPYGYFSMEIVSPVLKGSNGFEQIEIVCRALERKNVKVNASCGMHVHHGVGGASESLREQVCRSYANNEHIIDNMVSRSRRGNGNCFLHSTLNNAPIRNKGNRYFKINAFCAYGRHKTVEFRQHQGTTNATKICEWVLFTRHFLQTALNEEISRQCSIDNLLEKIKLSNKLSYWTERIQDLA